MDESLTRTLDDLSSALLGARLRAPAASEMFPGGYSGLALAHAGLDEVLPGRGHAERSAAEMARAIDVLGGGAVLPIAYGGFTGIAWVAEQLRGGEDDDDANAEIDAALLDFLSPRRRWRATYDLIGGLVGYGVYALERVPRPSAVKLLEAVVAHLASSAESREPGLSWRSRAEWWPVERRGAMSRGFNLGVAHGVPGVIALLGRLWRAGVERRTVARLLEGAVTWLLAQELPASSPSAFASNVSRGLSSAPSRSAWCYGDPGIAAALLVAARATGEHKWERAAIRIGARAAARDPETAGVLDAGLCHGAAGLAHVFHRLHVETNDERFERAAHHWLRRTIAMRRPGRGLGGYKALTVADDKVTATFRSDASFLTGTAGIALALAAFAAKKTERWAKWDRILLLSDGPSIPR